MKRADIIRQAKQAAARHQKNRKDPRYIRTIGLLIAKGFLHTNQPVRKQPNIRIEIEDAIWAGKNVEPRILEVLPAAVIRIGRHFNYNPEVHIELKKVVEALEQNREGEFFGIPAEKIRPWLNIRLKDRRVKGFEEKKVMKTFRLKPETISKLAKLKKASSTSEAGILESLIALAAL